MKRILITVALLSLPALAVAAPGNGVDLSWDDCVGGTAGVAAHYRNFTCSGGVDEEYPLVVQFRVDQPLAQAALWTAYLDFFDRTGDLGDGVTGFWRLEQSCPGNNLRGLRVTTTPSASCSGAGIADVSDGGTTGTSSFMWLSNTDPNYQPAPGRARVSVGFARDTPLALTAGTRYFLVALEFNNWNRTACDDGCVDPSTFACSQVVIESFDVPAVNLSGGDQFGDTVSINYDLVPVLPTTWGRIKAMYR